MKEFHLITEDQIAQLELAAAGVKAIAEKRRAQVGDCVGQPVRNINEAAKLADMAHGRIAHVIACLDLNKPAGTPLQPRVAPWMQACFGPEVSADKVERNHRFLEEAIELVQACGCTQSEAHQLVDYVFGRPVGEPDQEVGGVMITLAALCLANDLDMHAAGERELERIWTMVEKIRAKQASKPKHSPLPVAPGTSGLQFPTMLRKMWTGAEVQAWLDEQGELIRLRDIPEGCTPTDARVLREANHKLAAELAALRGYRNRAELLAEDLESLHLCLDDAGVPRSDAGGNAYSLWGRVQQLLSTAPAPVGGAAEGCAATLLRVIQRLNQNPYNLTKSECIRVVEEMRDESLIAAPQQGGQR